MISKGSFDHLTLNDANKNQHVTRNSNSKQLFEIVITFHNITDFRSNKCSLDEHKIHKLLNVSLFAEIYIEKVYMCLDNPV